MDREKENREKKKLMAKSAEININTKILLTSSFYFPIKIIPEFKEKDYQCTQSSLIKRPCWLYQANVTGADLSTAYFSMINPKSPVEKRPCKIRYEFVE